MNNCTETRLASIFRTIAPIAHVMDHLMDHPSFVKQSPIISKPSLFFSLVSELIWVTAELFGNFLPWPSCFVQTPNSDAWSVYMLMPLPWWNPFHLSRLGNGSRLAVTSRCCVIIHPPLRSNKSMDWYQFTSRHHFVIDTGSNLLQMKIFPFFARALQPLESWWALISSGREPVFAWIGQFSHDSSRTTV